MQLQTRAAGIRRGLLIEQRPPILRRQQDDVVGRRLRLGSARQPDRLEHRVLVRQVDDSGDDDIDRADAGPVDRHFATDRSVKVRRRLLGQQRPRQGSEQQPDLAGQGRRVSCGKPDCLAGAGRLGRALGRRAEARHVRIERRKHHRDRRGVTDSVHGGLRVAAVGELDLPVDGHALHRAGGHVARSAADEVE